MKNEMSDQTTQMLGEIAMMISDDVPRSEGLCTTADSVRWLRDKLRETNSEVERAWMHAGKSEEAYEDEVEAHAKTKSEVARLRECVDRLKNYRQMKDERDEARGRVCELERVATALTEGVNIHAAEVARLREALGRITDGCFNELRYSGRSDNPTTAAISEWHKVGYFALNPTKGETK